MWVTAVEVGVVSQVCVMSLDEMHLRVWCALETDAAESNNELTRFYTHVLVYCLPSLVSGGGVGKEILAIVGTCIGVYIWW